MNADSALAVALWFMAINGALELFYGLGFFIADISPFLPLFFAGMFFVWAAVFQSIHYATQNERRKQNHNRG